MSLVMKCPNERMISADFLKLSNPSATASCAKVFGAGIEPTDSNPPEDIDRRIGEERHGRSPHRVRQRNNTQEGSSEFGVQAPPHSMPASLKNSSGHSAGKGGRGRHVTGIDRRTAAARRAAMRPAKALPQGIWPRRPQRQTARAPRDESPAQQAGASQQEEARRQQPVFIRASCLRVRRKYSPIPSSNVARPANACSGLSSAV